MRLFGLIGYPLEHSFSGDYFAKKFEKMGIKNCEYHLFPLSAIEGLPQLVIRHPNLEGLNVTVPYKQAVKPYLNTLDGEAFKVGAVNTIKIFHQGKDFFMKGFNTDIHGFRESLKPLLQSWHNNALILGSGGASLAVKHILAQLGISFWVVSRKNNPDNVTYENLTSAFINHCTLIINTTPLGMHPRTEECPPIPYEGITSNHLVYDLIYNPSLTRFMAEAQKRGAMTKNGYEMLEKQAEKSWEIWNKPDL